MSQRTCPPQRAIVSTTFCALILRAEMLRLKMAVLFGGMYPVVHPEVALVGVLISKLFEDTPNDRKKPHG